MAYNRANLIRRYMDVQRVTQEHYIEGVTTYSGIWRRYIEPRFHYSYTQYINILGMGGLEAELEAELSRLRKSQNTGDSGKGQYSLLDVPGFQNKD